MWSGKYQMVPSVVENSNDVCTSWSEPGRGCVDAPKRASAKAPPDLRIGNDAHVNPAETRPPPHLNCPQAATSTHSRHRNHESGQTRLHAVTRHLCLARALRVVAIVGRGHELRIPQALADGRDALIVTCMRLQVRAFPLIL